MHKIASHGKLPQALNALREYHVVEGKLLACVTVADNLNLTPLDLAARRGNELEVQDELIQGYVPLNDIGHACRARGIHHWPSLRPSYSAQTNAGRSSEFTIAEPAPLSFTASVGRSG
jgi:hypothetical protein